MSQRNCRIKVDSHVGVEESSGRFKSMSRVGDSQSRQGETGFKSLFGLPACRSEVKWTHPKRFAPNAITRRCPKVTELIRCMANYHAVSSDLEPHSTIISLSIWTR